MDISIIIPCYNHGLYIQEAIDSVLDCKGIHYEIIIVDDGSTDFLTIKKLKEIESQGFKVIYQENQGPSKARNVAIEKAKGKYILPLDADNKIISNYINKGIDLLEKTETDIVYCNPIFIGQNREREFVSKPFSSSELYFNNFIDTCSIFKKEVWEKLGGFDENINVYEDWEFWLNASIQGFKFHYLNENLFYYRILENSLIDSTNFTPEKERTHCYILEKHLNHFITEAKLNYSYGKMYQRDRENPLRSIFKYLNYFLDSIMNRLFSAFR